MTLIWFFKIIIFYYHYYYHNIISSGSNIILVDEDDIYDVVDTKPKFMQQVIILLRIYSYQMLKFKTLLTCIN